MLVVKFSSFLIKSSEDCFYFVNLYSSVILNKKKKKNKKKTASTSRAIYHFVNRFIPMVISMRCELDLYVWMDVDNCLFMKGYSRNVYINKCLSFSLLDFSKELDRWIRKPFNIRVWFLVVHQPVWRLYMCVMYKAKYKYRGIFETQKVRWHDRFRKEWSQDKNEASHIWDRTWVRRSKRPLLASVILIVGIHL